jgi:hypothetical protein
MKCIVCTLLSFLHVQVMWRHMDAMFMSGIWSTHTNTIMISDIYCTARDYNDVIWGHINAIYHGVTWYSNYVFLVLVLQLPMQLASLS